jgi:hypothetical protein
MRTGLAAAIFAVAAAPSLAHRLDEYLQGTIISVEKNRLEAQMTLTPGVAVYSRVIASIDTDGNGAISETEQRAYAVRVLRDLLLTIDRHRLTPRLLSVTFPAMEEMKEGRGEIQIEFDADLPSGGRDRILTLENHHQTGISVYQVNCLVPRDPHIRIAAQNRNYSQSHYELEYSQTDVRSDLIFPGPWSGRLIGLSAIALALFTWLAFVWRGRAWPRRLV